MTATIEQKAAAWDALRYFQESAERRANRGLDDGLIISAVMMGSVVRVYVARDGVHITTAIVLKTPDFEIHWQKLLEKAIATAADKTGVLINPADFIGPDCTGQVPS